MGFATKRSSFVSTFLLKCKSTLDRSLVLDNGQATATRTADVNINPTSVLTIDRCVPSN